MNKGGQTTRARLMELFDYDPETGIFVRKVAVCNAKVGRETGSVNTGGHLGFRIDKKMYLAHRLAWLYVHGAWPTGQIDHINGIPTDNRIDNLRDVSRSINSQNLHAARRDNKVGMLGVCWRGSSKKFIAQIQVGGKVRHLGMFKTAEDAHQAYLQAKRQHHPGCTI